MSAISGEGHIVTVGINAKNRMGGYTGEKDENFFLKDNGVLRLEFYHDWKRVQDRPDEEPSDENPLIDNSSTTQGMNGVIIQLSGSGHKNTRPFKANGPWEIQWDVKGSFFALMIHKADGSFVDMAATQQCPGKGSSYQPKSGRYYLDIKSIGDWQVTVIDVR